MNSTEPSVCCVMLTRDRPEMAARAVRCFRAQTYGNARLCVYDTGDKAFSQEYSEKVAAFHFPESRHFSVGALRNRIAGALCDAPAPPDIFIHWDDDEYSHPNRIAEQVAFLQASGCDAVGYREMLFWDTQWTDPNACDSPDGEAWLYTNTDPVYCLGTSLCYWRRVWEARPFPDKTTGEDFFWLQGVNGQKRLNSRGVWANSEDVDGLGIGSLVPRMIATIHGGNSASRIQPGTMEWTRVPEWDDVCRRTLDAS